MRPSPCFVSATTWRWMQGRGIDQWRTGDLPIAWLETCALHGWVHGVWLNRRLIASVSNNEALRSYYEAVGSNVVGYRQFKDDRAPSGNNAIPAVVLLEKLLAPGDC